MLSKKKDELATLDKNKYEYAEWNIPIKCNCFYVIPQKELHNSGYKCLKIIACLDNGKKAIRTINSDVIRFNVDKSALYELNIGLSNNYLYSYDVDKYGNQRFFTNRNTVEFLLDFDLSTMEITVRMKGGK